MASNDYYFAINVWWAGVEWCGAFPDFSLIAAIDSQMAARGGTRACQEARRSCANSALRLTAALPIHDNVLNIFKIFIVIWVGSAIRQPKNIIMNRIMVVICRNLPSINRLIH